MIKFSDIPQFPQAYYNVNVSFAYIKNHLENWNDRTSPLIMNPEWQRGHVWTLDQKSAYMEYRLKGGTTGRNVYFNCSTWNNTFSTPIYCVDGLQRINAVLDFLDNKVPVFGGNYLSDFENDRFLRNIDLIFSVLCISNKRELLKVYLDFNSGGTPHNPNELERVEKMMENTDHEELI